MKSVIKPLAKSVLVPLGLTAAASAADAGIHKKILGSGHNNNTTLIISNDEMDNFSEIVKSLEDAGVLLKRVSETIQNEAKEQRGRFLSMLLGTLRASLLGDLLIKNLQVEEQLEVVKEQLELVMVPKVFLKKILIPPHPLTNFQTQAYYQNEPRFNGVFSRDNLSNIIKIGAYVINLDEYHDIGTH